MTVVFVMDQVDNDDGCCGDDTTDCAGDLGWKMPMMDECGVCDGSGLQFHDVLIVLMIPPIVQVTVVEMPYG